MYTVYLRSPVRVYMSRSLKLDNTSWIFSNGRIVMRGVNPPPLCYNIKESKDDFSYRCLKEEHLGLTREATYTDLLVVSRLDGFSFKFARRWDVILILHSPIYD